MNDNTQQNVEDLADRIAAKFPLRDIRERAEESDREHWDEYDEDDYIDFHFKAGDVLVDKDGTTYLVGDINLARGECSCCSVGSSNKAQWKGYIPFEDYANVK